VTTFSVKNFEKFQHYKDRSPPWIKLYNELLDDYQFACLQDASKLHLIMIWLLASRSDNRLPYDPAWVAKRINATAKVDLDALARSGFLIVNQALQSPEQDASKPLAECLSRERDRVETETETETEKRTRARGPKPKLPIDPDRQPDEQDRAFAEARGVSVGEQWPLFVNNAISRDATSADWHANWRTWCLRAPKFAANSASGSGRMVHRQKPNSLVAAVRQAVADAEGQP
jgi:hypothetical protein